MRVVIIPAFNEQDALPLLVTDLMPLLTRADAVVIVDDSESSTAALTAERCAIKAGDYADRLLFVKTGTRGGRGAAVRRGLTTAARQFPNAEFFLECDADGSHRAIDISKVLITPHGPDVVVGSRYLPESRIIGWSKSRRFQSRLLNLIIPRMFNLQLNDITNGLRRYSRDAVSCLLDQIAISTNFIYLTEEALILHRSGMTFFEVPIVFEERRAGRSSVTTRELRDSLLGLLRILLKSRTLGQATATTS